MGTMKIASSVSKLDSASPRPRPFEKKKKNLSRPAKPPSPPQAPHVGGRARWLRLGRRRRRRRRAVVRPDDAADQPALRPGRGARAARGRRRQRLLSSSQRRQRGGRDSLHDVDGAGRQRRDKHQHELRRAGLGDELELREEREEMKEGREGKRGREERDSPSRDYRRRWLRRSNSGTHSKKSRDQKFSVLIPKREKTREREREGGEGAVRRAREALIQEKREAS